jgi:hypothetical protein
MGYGEVYYKQRNLSLLLLRAIIYDAEKNNKTRAALGLAESRCSGSTSNGVRIAV